DRESLAGAGHVVHAQDGGSMLGRLHGQPDRGRVSQPRLLDAGQPADEALARGADEDRIARSGETAGALDQGEVLLDALAEADARIDGDPVARHPRRLAGPGTLEQEGAHILDDVAISRTLVLILLSAA